MHSVTHNAISIGELSRHSGLSTHTLRFYEAQGILQPVSRNASGHRQYDANDVLWLEFVLRLKDTGMPLAGIKQYAALRAQGEATLEARLAMLKLHRQRLASKIEELTTCAAVLDEKMRTYRKMLAKPPAPPSKAAP
nr:MerR family transcriptional regulator [uncultured Rhodoferax sp.]